ncbi:hypothetical protein Patl1_07760 [Pistacia atlantica]|uniref:Uncharacterized protein n=1 Tax=Pistacia atlantica TaxID=434234 RepID=A0ACC1AKM0_9ROSI|nr:hypothetical protein Patl1_07760 [Pistacia atlantica]
MSASLQFLGWLNLNHCSLTKLPSNLGQLSLLRILELTGNNFETIPTSIVKLFRLWFLGMLPSLRKLQFSTEKLNAECCELLKELSGLTIRSHGFYNRTFNFTTCSNSDWYALRKIWIDSVLKMYSDTTVWWKVTKTSSDFMDGHQGCMCFSGSEIPEWFDIQSFGSSIELPQEHVIFVNSLPVQGSLSISAQKCGILLLFALEF